MNRYVIYPAQSIKDISDAIKEKRGISDDTTFTVAEMPGAIRAIRSGSESNENGSNNENNGQGAVSINLGIEINDSYPYTNAIENAAPFYLIDSNIFNEINNYFKSGRRVELIDNNNVKYYLTQIYDSDISIQKRTGSMIVRVNHFGIASYIVEDDPNKYLVTMFFTDSYT